MNFEIKLDFATKCYKFTYTVLNKPNLTENKPRLNPMFTFRVYSGFIPVLLEWARVNPK